MASYSYINMHASQIVVAVNIYEYAECHAVAMYLF